MPFMDHMSQEPTEDCLLVNMISTGIMIIPVLIMDQTCHSQA